MDINYDTNEDQRREHVAQMNQSLTSAGLSPDPDDLAMQRRYIAGTVSLDTLINSSRTYASLAQQRKRQAAVNFARASLYLSGFHLSQAAEERASQFVLGAINSNDVLRTK